MTCQGEGGIEIYLEPVLAAPRLVLLGHTPVVQSLARLGPSSGSRSSSDPPRYRPICFPPGVRVTSDIAGGARRRRRDHVVVVGTMGAGDEEALAAAAVERRRVRRLVASRKKAHYLIDYVARDGVAAERLARVKFPAGLDLGGMSASEIALSVLAEIVQRRYAKPNADARPRRRAEPTPHLCGAAAHRGSTAVPPWRVDPVCGMPVDTTTARYTIVGGRPHHLLLLPRTAGRRTCVARRSPAT